MAFDISTARPVMRSGFDLNTARPVQQRSNLLTEPGETLKRSGGEFVGGIVEAVKNPVQTAKSLGGLAAGVAQKLIPGEQEQEKFADAMGQFLQQRYGSLEAVRRTALEDPVGFASDLSVLLTGGGGALAKVGQVGKVGKLASAGQTLGKFGRAVDPLVVGTRAAGTGIKGARIGLSSVKSLDNPVISAAKRLGVQVPASAVTKSRVVPLFEGFAAKSFFGRGFASKIDDLKKSLVDIGDDLVKKTNRANDLAEAGEAVLKGAKNFRERFFDIKNELYSKAGFNEKGKLITISADKARETANFVDEIVASKARARKVIGKAADANIFNKIKNALKGKKKIVKSRVLNAKGTPAITDSQKVFVDATDIKSALDELNETLFTSTDPVITGNKAKLRKLAATLSDELDQAIVRENPQLAQELNRANRFFKLSLEEINSHFSDKIFKFADQPDKIIPSILNRNTSISDVKRIYRLIGPENKTKVQAAFLKDMFDKAKNAEGVFTPQSLARSIKSFSPKKLNKVLDPAQSQRVMDLAEVSRGLGRFEKVASGSQTGFLNRSQAELATLFIEPNVGIPLIISDLLGTKAITSGVGQKLLGEGVKLQGPGQAIIRSAPAIGAAGRTGRVGTIIRQRGEGADSAQEPIRGSIRRRPIPIAR